MTKDEFVKKAKELNYTDEQINDILALRAEEKRKYNYEMPFDDIVLVEQPTY